MANCIICLENTTKMAYCETCMESGQICHVCILKWGKNNDITICTICKQKTMKNLPSINEEEIPIKENVGILTSMYEARSFIFWYSFMLFIFFLILFRYY